jgi:hypothetical protein
MAARAGISQARALVHTDDLADEVDAATLKAWNRILRLLRVSPPPPDLQKRLAEMLRGISTDAIGRLTDGMTKLAKITHRQLAMDLVVESPRAVIALALQTTAVKEAKLTPAESAQVQAQLIPPITQTDAEAIVNAPSKGTTWQARIQAQTGLGSPDQIAALVAMQAAQGATVQQLTAALAPIVQGNRVTARRVARTEGLRVAHAARMQAFDGLGDMLIGYQIHGTMDWRIRPHHALRNGNVYKINPAPGELSVANDMPHPPMESDGSVAFNCRCYLSPVLSVDPDVENDPAAKALFLTNDKKLIPDPVVYSEWFDTATEQERRWAVGAGRLKAATDRLAPGEALTWSAVLDPFDGQLVTIDDIKNESDKERKTRMDGVADTIQIRRDLGVQVARFGYLKPPPAPPPPPTPEFSESETYTNYVGATFKFAILPDGEKVTWTVKDPDGKPDVTTGYTQNVVELNSIFKTGYFTIYVKPVPPLPDYVTDVDALLQQVSAKGFKPNVHLLKWDDKWLIPAGQYQKYKKGEVSIRTLANIYNKNLAKLKGDVAPGKFDKVTQHIPAPAPAPAPTPVIGLEFHRLQPMIMNSVVIAIGSDIKWTSFLADGSKTGKDDCSATDFAYRFNTGYYFPGFAPGTTPPVMSLPPAAQSIVGVGGMFHSAASTSLSQGIVTSISNGIVYWDLYLADGTYAGASNLAITDFNDLFTQGLKAVGVNPYHVPPIIQGATPPPAAAPAAAVAQPPVVGTLFHSVQSGNKIVSLVDLAADKITYNEYDSYGSLDGTNYTTVAGYFAKLTSGLFVLGPDPNSQSPVGVLPTPAPAVTAAQQPYVGMLFNSPITGNKIITSVDSTTVKYKEFDSKGNPDGKDDVTFSGFLQKMATGYFLVGPHSVDDPPIGITPVGSPASPTTAPAVLPTNAGVVFHGKNTGNNYVVLSSNGNKVKYAWIHSATGAVVLDDDMLEAEFLSKIQSGDIILGLHPTAAVPSIPYIVATTTTQAAPVAPVPSTVSMNIHEPTRWNVIPKSGTNKPALGIKPDAKGNRMPHVPAFVPVAQPTPPHKSINGPVEFPKNPDALKSIRVLGGSTGAELISDPATGRKFVRKMGASPEHLAEEVAADKIYAACGVAVPSVDTHTIKGKPVKLAEVIDGVTYADYEKTATSHMMEKLNDKMRQGFAADALMGNWDVMGMSKDNVMVTPAGDPIRIDNGGSLRFRAQGTPKKENWNAFPSELWSMSEDPPGGKAQGAGANSVAVFSKLKWSETVSQIEGLVQSRQQVLDAATDPEVKEMLGLRLDQFADIAATSRMLIADGWDEEYVKKITKHQCQMRQKGLVAKLPKRLGDVNALDKNKRERTEPVDENGKPFDDLRGKTGLSEELKNYINKNGGSKEFLAQYGAGQASASNNNNAVGAKSLLLKNRPGVKAESYYWDSSSKTKKSRDKKIEGLLTSSSSTEAQGTESLAILQAWTMELLRNVDMPNNNRQAGTMRVYRTETDHALPQNLSRANTGKSPRIVQAKDHLAGALESYASYKPVQVYNESLIVKEVPYHRVIGTYLMSIGHSQYSGMFASDRENEFVCMVDGIDAEYHGKPKSVGLSSWSDA